MSPIEDLTETLVHTIGPCPAIALWNCFAPTDCPNKTAARLRWPRLRTPGLGVAVRHLGGMPHLLTRRQSGTPGVVEH